MTEALHPFELAGLGRAPFRFAGMVEQDLCHGERILNREEYQRTGIALTTRPGGSCAYCGTAIVNMFDVISADEKRFHVGSECIRKTGDAKLVKAATAAERAHQRRLKAARDARALANLPRLILAARRQLRLTPHPRKWRAAQGGTMLEWAVWMVRNAGTRGRLSVASACRRALKGASK